MSRCVHSAESGVKHLSLLQRLWRGIRRFTDDDAYERYQAHHLRLHPGEPMMDPRAFYLAQQTRKWGGVQRCC